MKNFIKTRTYILSAILIVSLKISAITCNSTACGNWANGGTWNTMMAPACGDSIVIEAGDTVSITNQQNYSACGQAMKVVVKGILWFYNGSKLRLPCGSYLLVYPGGGLRADVGLSNSNLVEICGNVEWNSNTQLNGPACLPPSHPFCQSILPVELTGFKAEPCDARRTCLNWETASEQNNDRFEVERSVNGLDFEVVAIVGSQARGGDSHYKISYTAVDESPKEGINYYRLKQVDKDHACTYSKIISVKMNTESGLKFTVFPNLNSGEFNARISGLRSSGYMSILLRDQSGAIVYKTWQYVEDTSAQIRVVPVMRLPDGFYFCSFIIGETEHVVKIIVNNS